MDRAPDDMLNNAPPIGVRAGHWRLFLLFIALSLFLTGNRPALAQEPPAQFTCSVRFEGLPDSALTERFAAASATMAKAQERQDDYGAMMARARDDKDLFEKILRSHGYYRPFIQIRVSSGSKPAEVEILFMVTTGPLYRLREVSLLWNVEHPIPEGATVTGVQPGEPIDAAKVIDAEATLLVQLQDRGFPFARALPREVTVDHAARDGTVVYHIDQGPYAHFGQTLIEGGEGIDPLYLGHRIPWREGEPFRLSALEELRKSLEGTSLFSRVKVSHADAVGADGRLDISVWTLQRAPRTVSAGIYYRSDDKLGAKAGWEHRNFSGHADRLRILADVSAIRREGTFNYRYPELFDERFSLVLNGVAADETTVAYVSRYQDGSASVDAQVVPWLTVGVGGGSRRGETKTKATSRAFNYLLGYGIGYATIDRTDSPLDPTWGLRLSGWAEPFYGESDGDISFLKARGNADLFATYDGLPWSVTLALRGEMGALFGAEFERVPPDLRYYAGGAGSIRGYPYQTIGPEINGVPIGGRSVLAGSAETRFRFGG
ncbi:MAG: BamA/TamA family outer membrane protein, partial [Nitrospinae bacterium]|nr:BamA/TamA family outer membrane protein [Nitrospinota bacterium]